MRSEDIVIGMWQTIGLIKLGTGKSQYINDIFIKYIVKNFFTNAVEKFEKIYTNIPCRSDSTTQH